MALIKAPTSRRTPNCEHRARGLRSTRDV